MRRAWGNLPAIFANPFWKVLTLHALCACAILSFAFNTENAFAADARQPIEINLYDNLYFGKLIVSGVSSITIDPATNARSMENAYAAPGDMYHPAKFRMTGEPGEEILVTVPAEIPVSDGVKIINLKHNGVSPLKFDEAGYLELSVAGELVIVSESPPVQVEAAFDIFAEYLWGEEMITSASE